MVKLNTLVHHCFFAFSSLFSNPCIYIYIYIHPFHRFLLFCQFFLTIPVLQNPRHQLRAHTHTGDNIDVSPAAGDRVGVIAKDLCTLAWMLKLDLGNV